VLRTTIAPPVWRGGASPILPNQGTKHWDILSIDGRLCGLLVYADPLRPEALAVIQTLRSQGIRELVIFTGDQPTAARQVAASLGISRYVMVRLICQPRNYVHWWLQGERGVTVPLEDAVCRLQMLSQTSS
jgi:magnesium-transporting ATPase (P-type)